LKAPGADEGAGDDAADAQGVAEAAGDVAIAVEFGDGDDVLVGGDLEDAVGGGVADQRAGLDVFFAEFVDDGGAAGGLVADELAAGFLFEGGDQVGGERVDGGKPWKPGSTSRPAISQWPVMVSLPSDISRMAP
jgi:hypothetical protein